STPTGGPAPSPAPGWRPHRPCRSRSACRRPAAPDRRCRPVTRSAPRGGRRLPGRAPRATRSRVRPASPSSSCLLPLEVRHVLLTGRGRHHGHQLPAVLTPLVEDLLGGVDQQRNSRVLPLRRAQGTLLFLFVWGSLRPL